jgi:hypothetical protein
MEKSRCTDGGLPVGLFDNNDVNDRNHLTPGRTSEIDIWGVSSNKKVLHLFELKMPDNHKVGLLTEAFYYALFLMRVREYGVRCQKSWTGYEALMSADRIVMWLTGEKFHPLLLQSIGDGENQKYLSPIAMFNRVLAKYRIEMRILKMDVGSSEDIDQQNVISWSPIVV